MRPRDTSIPPEALQEFLEAVMEAHAVDDPRKEKRLLQSYAELKFRLYGAGRCSVCHTTVRHVLPVEATQEDGKIKEYECLCTRCMAAERATSQHVVIRVGRASVSYSGGKQRPTSASVPSARRRFHSR